jgi:hypothetical protein
MHRFNEHMDEKDGPLVFAHACELGLEGIVSKRRHSSYRSGRSPDWIKSKNPNAPAVRREAQEDWSRQARHSVEAAARIGTITPRARPAGASRTRANAR